MDVKEISVRVPTGDTEAYVDRVNWCQRTFKQGQFRVDYMKSKIIFEDAWAKTLYLLRWMS